MSSILLGQDSAAPREAHYYFSGYGLQAVRQGPWKLAVTPQRETMGKGIAPDAAGREPRLYNLDAEIGERTNVAAEHPDVVARLRELTESVKAEIGVKGAPGRRPAGKVENPVILYPAEPRKRRAKKHAKAVKTKSVALSTLKAGDSLSPEQAPQVVKTPFTIACTIEPQPADCVVVSHGGSAVGYTLYLKDKRAVFAVRHGQTVTRVTSDPLPNGPLVLQAKLAADGALNLSVNGQAAKPVRSPGLLPRQPAEDFDLGFDAKNTVDEYDGAKRPVGAVEKLVISAKP
ncbi:MAG: hypothetical protein HON70_25465 [Lentisphaerae bacterium]|nr:hypothetical protein [Lentisphaerota bacterium]